MVDIGKYTPHRGDMVWLNFQSQTGREQGGRRSAVVLSNSEYNKVVGLAIFCPITSKVKGYPFEVKIPANLNIEGVILVDQIKSLDWQKREVEFIGKVDDQTLDKVLSLLGKAIEIL